MTFHIDSRVLTGDMGAGGEINIYTFRQKTGSFNLEDSVYVYVGRWTVKSLAVRNKEGEADRSDKEEVGQHAADGHGGNVEREFNMRIGDTETAEQTHAWANMVG